MKQCCEKAVARLASPDSLVDILMITQNERDVAEHNAKQAQDAVKRVEDLHKSVYENRGVSVLSRLRRASTLRNRQSATRPDTAIGKRK